MSAALIAIGVLLLPAGAYVAVHVWRPIRRAPDEDLEGYLVRLAIWPPLALFIPLALIVAGLIHDDVGGAGWGGVVLAVGLEAVLVGIARGQRARRRLRSNTRQGT